MRPAQPVQHCPNPLISYRIPSLLATCRIDKETTCATRTRTRKGSNATQTRFVPRSTACACSRARNCSNTCANGVHEPVPSHLGVQVGHTVAPPCERFARSMSLPVRSRIVWNLPSDVPGIADAGKTVSTPNANPREAWASKSFMFCSHFF